LYEYSWSENDDGIAVGSLTAMKENMRGKISLHVYEQIALENVLAFFISLREFVGLVLSLEHKEDEPPISVTVTELTYFQPRVVPHLTQ